MSETMQSHYSRPDLVKGLLEELAKAGHDPSALQVRDLGAVSYTHLTLPTTPYV